MIEYKLDSCDLPASGGVFTGQIYGLSLPPAADRVQLIVKSAHSATLIVRIKEGDLHAGEYAGLAMVRDENFSVAQPFKITVSYQKQWAGWLVLLVAILIGAGVMGLRAAAASPTGLRTFVQFFTNPPSWLVIGAGAAAGYATLQLHYFNAESFPGRFGDFLALFLLIAGSVVAAGTATTIAAQGAANTAD